VKAILIRRDGFVKRIEVPSPAPQVYIHEHHKVYGCEGVYESVNPPWIITPFHLRASNDKRKTVPRYYDD
jgi:hypothetical protein